MGSARRKPRRRGSTLFKLLLVVIVIAGGTALGTQSQTVWHAVFPTTPSLTVDYRTAVAADSAVAAPELVVVNTSKKPVPLSDVTLRYYFTEDGTTPYGFNCVQAGVGCSNVSGSIAALSPTTSTADHYLQIGFAPGAGTLAPGQDSQSVDLQLYRLDHKPLDQANDRSFDAAITTFKPSRLVTAYLSGALVWGSEPVGGTTASAQGPSAPSPAAAPVVPAQTVFDDFHYSGPDDPALLAHGWEPRTGPGGPGISDTWSTSGVSFPSEASAQGGQVLQLQAGTDGTSASTHQAELESTKAEFFNGTYAARIYFANQPTSGPNGDHINESFYPISADGKSPLYSELDNEYMPNGGWGAPGPAFDTTSWYSAVTDDRVTRRSHQSLQGWHTMMITAEDGVVTYSMDGKTLFSSTGKYIPRESMDVDFSDWFIDLPFVGQRTWDMQVNWFYYKADQAVSLKNVQKAVAGFYQAGTHYINTVPKS